MKISRTTKAFGIVTAVLLISAAVVFAHGGWGQNEYGRMGGYGGQMMGPGYGGHMMDYQGYGPHMRGYGYGAQERLTDEQAAKLDQAREKFHKETQAIRGRLDEKSVALRNEMIKDAPDTAKAMKLQKEISELNAELDQKRLAHRLEVQKITPETFQGRGPGRGYGRGGGYGYCR